MTESSKTPVGVVLAGGRSRRFGRDKTLVMIGAKRSLEHVIDALKPHVSEVLIVGGDGPGRVADLAPGQGPLQGLLSAFRARPGRALMVLAADMPFVPDAVLARLANPVEPHDARVLVVDGRLQPLAARYEARAAPTLEEQWRMGQRSLVRALAALRLEGIAPTRQAAPLVADFDTVEDLRRLLQAAGVGEDDT